MSAEIRSEASSPLVLKWMEALAARECSTDDFLREMLLREQEDADLPWEVLAQLDQYFRRRRIPHDVFVSVKARLKKSSQHLGNDAPPQSLQVADDAPAPVKIPKLVIVDPPAAPEAPPAAMLALPAPAPAPAPAVASAPAPASALKPEPAPVVESRPAPQPAPPPAAVDASPAAAGTGRVLRPGNLLRGRYRVMEILRRDQTGLLVEAVDQQRNGVPELGHRVALLLFDARRSREPDLLARLYRLQSLSHPCILRMYDIDEDRGEVFVTLEWLTGSSLQQLISNRGGARLGTPTARSILGAVASALSHAHAHDVLHGDVNAANVFITESGEIRLRGFDLKGRVMVASPAADRLAFAWLAYELLSGLHLVEYGNLRRADTSELKQPAGITREQWRVLRDTLTGKDVRSGNVLSVFAADRWSDARFIPLSAFTNTPSGRVGRSSMWGAAAAAAALVAWLLIVNRDEPREPQAPIAAEAAQPVAPAEAQVGTAAPPVAAPAGLAVSQAAAPAAPESPVTYVTARLDLPASSVEVVDNQPFARVWVRRRANLNGTVTFRWWTETGSAILNRDFLRIEPRTELIADGDEGVELRIPLLSDPTRVQPRTFYVKISAPGQGAALGSRTLTQVTIVPADQPAAAVEPSEAPQLALSAPNPVSDPR